MKPAAGLQPQLPSERRPSEGLSFQGLPFRRLSTRRPLLPGSRSRERRGRLFIRRWRANWRDTVLLLREFRVPLAAFSLALVGGGLVYYSLALHAGEPVASPIEAIYWMLGLTFLQPIGGFPHTWYLETFYFLMPVIGTAILAQGVADFGIAFFNRKTRSKEWEASVASTFNNHIILVGLGHLGYHVVANLHEMQQEIVVVEQNPAANLVAEIRKMDIPILEEDGTRESALVSAGVCQARSIILCTQNDSLNLQMAVKARSLNPKIQVVVRIFDSDFAQALQEQFGFLALSATGMSAPVFAAAAAGVDITRPITVEGHALSLARLHVRPGNSLAGITVSQIEQQYDLSIILLRQDGNSDFHPAPNRSLAEGDVIAVLGSPQEINHLVQEYFNP